MYSELFILERKSMDWGGGGGLGLVGAVDIYCIVYSMLLPVKRTWFFCLALVQDKKISHH